MKPDQTWNIERDGGSIQVKKWKLTNKIPMEVIKEVDSDGLDFSCNICSSDITLHVWNDGDVFIDPHDCKKGG